MFHIKDELKRVPEKSGIYIMKDVAGQIIYIGKAVNLKKRVSQYFRSVHRHPPKVAAMVRNVATFEYIITDSELEALILECNFIKKHKPKYNILLKDDKTYPYIKITVKEEYPRIFMTRKIGKDGAKYYGPYSSAFDVRDTLDLLKKIFPLKTCNKVLPRDVGKSRPCLNFYIGKCMGPCRGGVDKENYHTMIRDVCKFLEGKENDILKNLKKQMEEASAALQFEKAAVLRDRITAMMHILDKQKVFSTDAKDRDIIALSRDAKDDCILFFFVRGGKLLGKEHFILEDTGDVKKEDLIASVVKQFYDSATFIPQQVVLQSVFSDSNIVAAWLSQKKGSKVKIICPQKGETKRLVELVHMNAKEILSRYKERMIKADTFKNALLAELKEVMHIDIDAMPGRIEAYDISNTGTSEMTGSMVVLINGEFCGKEYKHFKMKEERGTPDDYACMQEICRRRFMRMNDEKAGEVYGFEATPDFIFLDGGMGHVHSILQVKQEMCIQVPLWGMVKDDKHRTYALISEKGKEYVLKQFPHLFRFITQIQNEAHRVALSYNKKLREKRYKKSALDDIKGVGEVKKKALLKHFGGIVGIKQAGVDDLTAVEGIHTDLAETIYTFFHRKEE